MKLTLLITAVGFSLLSHAQPGNLPEDKKLVISALAGVMSSNQQVYLETTYNKEALLFLGTKGRTLSAEEKKRAEDFVNGLHNEYVEEQKQRFNSIQAKVNELRINWSRIKVDSIALTKDNDNFSETSAGTIYFRAENNSEFYKSNFQGLMKCEGRYFIETIYVPYVYTGPKNRLATAGIKKQYVDTCVKDIKYKISITRGTMLKAIYGDCLPCHCERQYFSETEQEDGVIRIKNAIRQGVPTIKDKNK